MTETKAFNALGAVLLLQGCGWQSEPLVISQENAENVKLVLYLSDGDSDWKSVGEFVLIDSGETLHVQRNRVRPEPQLITNDGNKWYFEKVLKKTPHVGKDPLRLDRKNGVVCNSIKCAKLYSICPRPSETSSSEKKCVIFPRD